jgi:hypothetical protein
LIIEVGKKCPHIRGMAIRGSMRDEAITQAPPLRSPHRRVCIPAANSHLQILRNCHPAVPPGSALPITESVLKPDRSGTPFATLMSLHMLLLGEPGARDEPNSNTSCQITPDERVHGENVI